MITSPLNLKHLSFNSFQDLRKRAPDHASPPSGRSSFFKKIKNTCFLEKAQRTECVLETVYNPGA